MEKREGYLEANDISLCHISNQKETFDSEKIFQLILTFKISTYNTKNFQKGETLDVYERVWYLD
jgi:hypothetical protein